MREANAATHFGAARSIASLFGALAGLGGIVHGVGETLQGNVAPAGIVVNSWTEGPIATNMGGEPAMTILPSLLLTGFVTLLVSSAVIVWSLAFVTRKHGGWVLILLCIAMLLVGGGFAPPIVGILAGVAGTAIDAPRTGWRTRLSDNMQRTLAGWWTWVFAVCVINGVFLVIGSLVLVYLFDLNNPGLFVGSFLFAVVSLPLAIVVGIAHDIENAEGGGTRER